MIATILLPAAGMLLLAVPLEALYLFYCWDVRTWPARIEDANCWRAMRDSGKLARDQAHARRDRRGAVTPPPYAVAVRDRATQPVLARVDLRRDTVPPPPGRLARLRHAHHGRPA